MKRLPIRAIRLMPDYHCFPLWWGAGEAEVGNIDPRDLGLSDDLVAALGAWAAAYDSTLNQDDPARSGFATPAAEQAFRTTGEILRDRLRAELGTEIEVALHPS